MALEYQRTIADSEYMAEEWERIEEFYRREDADLAATSTAREAASHEVHANGGAP